MDIQKTNPHSNYYNGNNQNSNPNYNNNSNIRVTYNQGYIDNASFSQSYNDGNSNYNAYDEFYQDYNVGSPQPLTSKQLKFLTIPEVVSKSFLFMFVALLITAFAAFTTSKDFAYNLVMNGSYYLLFIAEIAIVLVSNVALRKNNAILAGVLYAVYSYITGVSLSVIFLVYSMSSIASAFVITALVFAVMAVYGLITKADLSSVGNICLMGLVGIIIASVANIFILHNTGLDLAISYISVLVFVGLTAYDTQKIKARAESATDETIMSLALFGAFELYLDFINLFLDLLKILGSRD